MRRLRTQDARAALARAEHAARQAGIPALTAEVETASLILNTPAARLIAHGEERLLLLEEVEALLASKALVVDACRNVVRNARTVVSLARVRCCSRSHARWAKRGRETCRETCSSPAHSERGSPMNPIARACGSKSGGFAGCCDRWPASPRPGEALRWSPRRAREVVVLARPVEEEHAAVLAFLADGESWSSSALALALGASQRTVQRALDSLAPQARCSPSVAPEPADG